MATRVFFTEDTTAPAVSPTISSANWLHINTVRRKLLTTADSSTLGTTAYTPDSADDLIAGNAHHRQYISDPLGPQTILSSSTVQAQFQTLEAHANNNLALTLKVYTVDSTGAVKSALLAIVGKGTEPTTALRNTSFAATALNGSGGNVTVAEGDRIVVEIGLGGTPTATSGTQGHNGSIRWGCSASSGDLPVDETQAGTTYRPWVEFSQNLIFLKSAAPAADDAEQYVDTIGGGKYALFRWNDSATQSTTGPSAALTVTPAADPLGSYADTSTRSLTFATSQTDALGSYADAATKALRTLPGWNDSLATFVTGITAISVDLPADNLGGYADQAPTILFTGAIAITPPADSLSLLDQAPVILFTAALAVTPVGDSLGLYLDQAPTIREALLSTPAADSLPAYADSITGFFTVAARSSDDLNLWTDQRNVSMGAGAITAGPPSDSLNNWADAPTIGGTAAYSVTLSDSLGLYADQPTISETFSAAFAADSLGLYLDQAPVISRQGILLAAPPADPLAAYTETINGFFTIGTQLSDALVYADQLLISAGGAKVAGFTDALGSYSDALTTTFGLTLTFAEGLNNWSDQVNRSGVRVGWGDSVVSTVQVGSPRTVDLASIRPVPLDILNLRLGYNYGTVIYLVDENGNYIVDENGNRFIVDGLIDNLLQGDALAVTRTTAGLTPRLVSISDNLAAYGESIQVDLGIVSIQVPLSDALANYSDPLQVQRIGTLAASLSDALGGYSDTSPAMTTSGEERVSLADTLVNYDDSIQLTRIGVLSVSSSDALANYADAALVNTSGGLLISLFDVLPIHIDTLLVQQGGILTVALAEPLDIYIDTIVRTTGILRSASDNLAAYSDSPSHSRGLMYSTPADGLANYLDNVTTSGLGQVQVSLSDNLGQYTDAPPNTFANFRAQPPADALAYADSLRGSLGLTCSQVDGLFLGVRLPADELDARVGLFNELRYELSEDLDQWADIAIYSTTFFAVRLNGKVADQLYLTGKLIEEQIELGGKLDDKANVMGELYIGEP